MNRTLTVPQSCLFAPVALALLLQTATTLPAATNDWISPTDGLWRITNNWSLAQAPTNSSNLNPTLITNAGTKTVTIDSATAAVNLSIRALTVSAPVGATNTLVMDNATNATFTTSGAFLVGTRSALLITNTAISTTSAFDISNATVVLNSGSLTCSSSCNLHSGSFLMNSGTVTVGPLSTGFRIGRLNGASAALTVNGGTLNTLRLTLGSVAGAQTSLTIAGGSVICTDSFSAAQNPNTSGNVTLSAGSLFVTNGIAKIADRAAATFNQGGGTAAFAYLSIGDIGVGTYNLTNGNLTVTPRTTNDLFIVGNLENGTYNQFGGVADILSEVHLADNFGYSGAMNILGGQLYVTNDLLAIGRYGSGTMLVSNATVVVTNISVGRHLDADGTLTVESGATMTVLADLSIARLTGSFGHMFLKGGLVSLTNNDLWVGRAGTGDLTLTGGTVAAKTLHVGESDDGTNAPAGTLVITGGEARASQGFHIGTVATSSGTATISGGSLVSTNAGGTNLFTIANGNLTLNGGTVIADSILLTNAAGTLTFYNGTVRAKAMTVANGASFVVGDGVNPATLQLQGGTYSFADGLVISPNATVTGCGTIVGAMTNNGTYFNPCAGPPAPNITSVTHAGTTATISFLSTNGVNYTIEYKNDLSDPAWTPLPPAQPGTGGELTLSDSAATNRTRFYRVGVQ